MDWGVIVEASEACSVVGCDEVFDVCFALCFCSEGVFAPVCSGLWMVGDSLCDAPVEAFDHAVGLRMEGFCEAMLDVIALADAVEGVKA